MATREIIEIDEAKCTGCGLCETGCPEGALRVVGGKARLVGENLCDGLGACVGGCPEGAITVTRREAEAYDEAKTLEGMVRLGPAVLRAHLDHLRHHGQELYLRQAADYLAAAGIALPAEEGTAGGCADGSGLQGCPGSRARVLRPAPAASALSPAPSAVPSELAGWPIQLHLVNPRSPQFAGARLLVAADCTAFALGSFHSSLLAGRALVIACPKLDQGREIYVEKLAALIEASSSVEVAIMEVPCCGGLAKLVLEARGRCARQPPVETVVLGIEGGIVARRTT